MRTCIKQLIVVIHMRTIALSGGRLLQMLSARYFVVVAFKQLSLVELSIVNILE
jgi:hypothetical protein